MSCCYDFVWNFLVFFGGLGFGLQDEGMGKAYPNYINRLYGSSNTILMMNDNDPEKHPFRHLHCIALTNFHHDPEQPQL